MHVVVFCLKHVTGQVEIYYCAGMSLYKELLIKPKAAKVVMDWFMQTNLLLYLLLVKKLAGVKRGGQKVFKKK